MFGSAKQLYSGEVYIQSATYEGEYLGTIGQDQYGDLYRYGKVGASGITSGKVQLAPAPKTNHHNIAVAAAVTADGRQSKVTVTLGATAAVADEYAGGYIAFSDVAPEGIQYRITGHPAASSSASLEVTVDRPWVENISTSSEVTLVHNAWNAVVEAAANTRRVAGVPLIDMTAGYYGWFKVAGVAAVLADQAVALGSQITPSASVAGAVIANSDVTAPQAETIIGFANILAGVDTEFRPVTLNIQ